MKGFVFLVLISFCILILSGCITTGFSVEGGLRHGMPYGRLGVQIDPDQLDKRDNQATDEGKNNE